MYEGEGSDIGDDAVIASSHLTCTLINVRTTERVGEEEEAEMMQIKNVHELTTYFHYQPTFLK